jgi:hypothetical protein
LEKKAKQVLPGSEWEVGERGRVQGGEMAQTMYAHLNKCIKEKEKKKEHIKLEHESFPLCIVR